MAKLRIAEGLTLPADAVTQTFVIFGKRGSGKTNTATVLAEEMLSVAPIVVLDPIDAWWGLRSKYKVYVFGGRHCDLPLSPENGELMARVFIEHRVSMVLAMSGWTVADRAKFVTAFALYLLKHNDRVPVHVFLEEADAFAPQKPYPGEQAMLGAVDRMVRWGRQEGIGATLITQRSAKVNKDVTTQAETLIAHRTIGPQDRDAIEAWIRFHGSTQERMSLLSTLPTLVDGRAWIWSPEWLGLLDRFQVRRRHSFDSAATPKIGEKRVEPKQLEQVDLDKLRGQLSASIEQAKANDPRELRARIRELERQLSTQKPQVVEKVVEKEVVREVWPSGFRSIRSSIEAAVLDLEGQVKELARLVADTEKGRSVAAVAQTQSTGSLSRRTPDAEVDADKVGGPPLSTPRTTGSARSTTSLVSENGELPNGGQQKILAALAELCALGIKQPSREQLAWAARMKPSGGYYNNLLGSMRTAGWIDYPMQGAVAFTDKGASITPLPEEPLTNLGLQSRVLSRLKGLERKIILALIPAYPGYYPRYVLAEMVDKSGEGGYFNNTLGKLRTLGLIEYPAQGVVRASAVLFLS